MKIFKIVVLIVIVGFGAFLYTNPYMIKPIMAQVQKVQDMILGSSDDEQNSIVKVEPVNTYLIDDNINKEEFDVNNRIKNIYIEISNELIRRDIEIRKRLLFVQDKSSEDINTLMLELEPRYEIEREKVINYCKYGSPNCLVEVSLTGDSVEGSDIKINVRYILDLDSSIFFNKVEYVNKEEDKWFEAKLIGINEKRYYPKFGKFQGREQNSMTKSDLESRVDVSHILEGNSDQWNVKFDTNTSEKITLQSEAK